MPGAVEGRIREEDLEATQERNDQMERVVAELRDMIEVIKKLVDMAEFKIRDASR